jgi:DNA polymerase-3 subunit delta
MTVENIISGLRKKEYKPVYWLEGDEEFFIDEIIDFATSSILPESEASLT